MGVEHPLRPISEQDRLHDLSRMLQYGNHKSAETEKPLLLSMLQEEVTRMWQLPLPLKALPRIPRGVLAPLGMVKQDSINERGKIVDKWWLTHDQTYEIVPGANCLVNHRVIFDELTPCRYGRAIMQYIYSILFLWKAKPNMRILQTKANLKAAYCRLHHTAGVAVQALTRVDNMLLVALRLTFGGAPNPSMWSDVSKMAFDIANDLVQNEGWDPEQHHLPHQHLIAGRVECLDDDVPFAPSLPVIVDGPFDTAPKCDGYIDDAFMAF